MNFCLGTGKPYPFHKQRNHAAEQDVSVKTIDRVAVELGETVDRIFDLAIGMETEDGIIWVYGPGDDSVIAFTPLGSKTCKCSWK
ncbi:hypothetical protein [Sulfitobacter faviae]|jgi:hypothetical protein|uniref:hypothetical protein n=1 Tax=Sulfitobacter faviae TaxID=1775881 RepID=UPI00245511B4|nr:hypothetical protein [Sulfitobacter faviae]